ncbi:MAG: SBBP repeat-containing protein [Ferruginibacter sp.]
MKRLSLLFLLLGLIACKKEKVATGTTVVPPPTTIPTVPPITPVGMAFSIGGAAGNDYGKDIAIDGGGNMIVASYFYGTVDFDPGTGINNRISLGTADVGISKYSSAGQLLWAVSFGSPGVDIPHSVTTDAAGNIYVAGYYSGTCDFDPGAGTTTVAGTGGTAEAARDGFIVKFNSNGSFAWVKTFANAGTEENCFGVDADDAGSVYITGVFRGTVSFDSYTLISNGVQDIVLAKLNAANGSTLWAYGMGGAGQDEGSAVEVDKTGNIIFTGYFSQSFDADPSLGISNLVSAGSFDTYFVKFNPAGTLAGANSFGGAGADIVAPGGIAVDNSNNIYICGNFTGTCNFGGALKTSNGGQDLFVAKFSNTGAFQSLISAGGLEGDQCHRVATDASGNIYITGWFRRTTDFGNGNVLSALASGGGHDIYFAKYSAAGSCQWVHRAGGTGSGADELSLGTTVDLVGNDKVVFGGRFHGSDDFDPDPAASKTLTSLGGGDIWLGIYNTANGYLFK